MLTKTEIRQRLTYLLPAGLTDDEWNSITNRVLEFIEESKIIRRTTCWKREYYWCELCKKRLNAEFIRALLTNKYMIEKISVRNSGFSEQADKNNMPYKAQIIQQNTDCERCGKEVPKGSCAYIDEEENVVCIDCVPDS